MEQDRGTALNCDIHTIRTIRHSCSAAFTLRIHSTENHVSLFCNCLSHNFPDNTPSSINIRTSTDVIKRVMIQKISRFCETSKFQIRVLPGIKKIKRKTKFGKDKNTQTRVILFKDSNNRRVDFETNSCQFYKFFENRKIYSSVCNFFFKFCKFFTYCNSKNTQFQWPEFFFSLWEYIIVWKFAKIFTGVDFDSQFFKIYFCNCSELLIPLWRNSFSSYCPESPPRTHQNTRAPIFLSPHKFSSRTHSRHPRLLPRYASFSRLNAASILGCIPIVGSGSIAPVPMFVSRSEKD